MTKPLVVAYWVKSNGRRQQPEIPSRHENSPVTPAAENGRRSEPSSKPLSRWRKLLGKR